MSELLPCPFCGGEAVYYSDLAEAECTSCHIETGFRDSKETAIAAWNRRADPGWIKVEDGLPEYVALVYIPDWGVEMAAWNGNRWAIINRSSRETFPTPTHWRPLPNPPEVGR